MYREILERFCGGKDVLTSHYLKTMGKLETLDKQSAAVSLEFDDAILPS